MPRQMLAKIQKAFEIGDQSKQGGPERPKWRATQWIEYNSVRGVPL